MCDGCSEVGARIKARLEAAEHEHVWQRHQNVTSRGYVLPPYESCSCGKARTCA